MKAMERISQASALIFFSPERGVAGFSSRASVTLDPAFTCSWIDGFPGLVNEVNVSPPAKQAFPPHVVGLEGAEKSETELNIRSRAGTALRPEMIFSDP